MKPNESIRKKLIDQLVSEMPILRAKLGISQEELANKIGVTRQTLNSVESKKRDMTWPTYLAIFCFFSLNQLTASLLEYEGIWSSDIINELKV